MRHRICFWLDDTKPDEDGLLNEIARLKAKRGFIGALRDGLRLILDLRQGKIEVLQELFPWVLDTTPSSNDIATRSDFERLEQLLTTFRPTHNVAQTHTRALTDGAHRALDGIDLEIKEAKSDENAAYNMILSGVSMGITTVDELPDEVVEYAVQKGKLPESARRKKDSLPAIGGGSSQNDGGPKAMDVPQFATPSFDDLDF